MTRALPDGALNFFAMTDKILAIKGDMQTLYGEDGKALPVTILLGKETKFEETLKEGDKITVIGTSKGKGFAGVIKRHGFSGGPKTHGQSDRERAPGSIGSTTTPGRVYKGKRMAGRMGGVQVTVKNLTVCRIDTEKNLLYVCGAVPGVKRSMVIIRKV
jgi:large subunit ribosomal protein L3